MIKICSDLKAVNSMPSLISEIHQTRLDPNSYSGFTKHEPPLTAFWLSFYGGIFKVAVFTDEMAVISQLNLLLQSHKLPPPPPKALSKKEELEMAKALCMSKRATQCGSGIGSRKFKPGSKYCR